MQCLCHHIVYVVVASNSRCCVDPWGMELGCMVVISVLIGSVVSQPVILKTKALIYQC